MTRSHGGRSRGRNRPGVGRRDRYAGPRAAAARGESLVGTVIEVEVGSVAHGGFCVARHEGRVVFVRHTMPGERVRARVTEGGTENRFLRADAVEILTAAAERVDPRCRHAGPGGCGGCDWQHVSLPAQRELKAAVVEEQLRRLAGLERPVRVEALPGDDSGFHWRTRMEFAVGPDGRAGLRPHRSHAVLPITECPIAHPDLLTTDVLGQDWTGERALDVVVADSGTVVVPVPSGGSGPEITQLVAADRWSGELRLAARGFWQVHPSAAAALVDRVLGGLAAQRGERVLDLYAGVGLFALALADAVGASGAVHAVESDARAVADGMGNAVDRPWVSFRQARVEQAAATLPSADLVVLDPPRTGAGRAVIEAVCRLKPRAIAYVACDPAALARDLAYARDGGYALADLTAYDLFPMTQHVECVALLTKSGSDLL